MPSPRLRARRRRQDVVGRPHWLAFAKGPERGGPWGALGNCNDLKMVHWILDDMQSAWNSVKGILLAHWIDRNPGTRPWAWWQFSAPERHRRILSEKKYSLLSEPEPECTKVQAVRRTIIRFGLCGSWSAADMTDGLPVCESEYAYLARLGLLTAPEKQIAPSEFPATDKEELRPWQRDLESWLPLNL